MERINSEEPMTVALVALGCPKNIVDSEKMLARIGEGGFVLSGDIYNADIVVINTCGFIAPAKEEAIGEIKEAVRLKEQGSVRKVIVAGCLSQRMGKALADEVDGIDAIVGLSGRDKIDEIIRQTIAAGASPEHSAAEGFYLDESPAEAGDDTGRLLITPEHWAYLRISEGCDRKCAFCTIPAIRGRFRSKPQDLVLAEARELVDNGAVELSIIAQDSNYYRRDMGVKNGLSELLGGLGRIEALMWIRLMYLYPATIDENLIEAIAASEKVLNYIDMPIQHINDDILKSMNRADRKDKTVGLIENLRRAMDDVVLRTTIIVGFPGETDGQFEELLDFVRWAKFDALGCFTFYPETGTSAADMPGQVPDEVKQHRSETLMLAQQEIA
ncbi:MAG: 30S ribosomal protein S12 methylthiotransferase RimO, partial [Planctomycetes bacterium]|nr:30S ribosomal protein S12 methylthiotransferase RimO [Planctomycetota bacterium]